MFTVHVVHQVTVDVLVNDARQDVYGEFVDTQLERELDIIQLSIATVVMLTKLFLKDMVARNSGCIINVAYIDMEIKYP